MRAHAHGASYFDRLVECVDARLGGDHLLFTDWREDPDERLRGVRQRARLWWDRLSAAVPGLTLTATLLRRAFSEFRADHCQQATLHDSAGALGVLGVVGVLWAATGVMASVRTPLNMAWDTEKPRPFIRGKLVDLLLVAATVVLLLTAFAGTVLVNLPSVNRPPVGLNGPALTLATSVAGVALLTGTVSASPTVR